MSDSADHGDEARLLEAERPSKTAEYVALFRALESARPVGARLFSDPLAGAFLSAPLRAALALSRVPGIGRAVPAFIDRRWPGPRRWVVVRTLMIDAMTREALTEGAEQVVILGAGFDARAYRIAELARRPVFEVDQPATQAVKRERLESALGTVPASVRFVGIDFAREELGERLAEAGWRDGLSSFAILEGVISYLTREALDSTLAWFVGSCAPGSRIAFTYVDTRPLDSLRENGETHPWIASVNRSGEPFRLGFDPSTLGRELAARGLELIADESTKEGEDRLGVTAGGPEEPAFYRVALARVAA